MSVKSRRCPDMHLSRVGKKKFIEISRCLMFASFCLVFNFDQWKPSLVLLSLLEIPVETTPLGF